MSEDLYKSIHQFEGGIRKWPIFYLKFKTLLESKGLLHIIERINDAAVPGESSEEKVRREKLAVTRSVDDARVRAWLLNKISDDVLHLVEELKTAYEMVQCLEKQFQSTSAASVFSRLDKHQNKLSHQNKITNQNKISHQNSECNINIFFLFAKIPSFYLKNDET